MQIKTDAEEELNNSVSDLVREWAEKMMPGTKFGSLEDLAAHLIDKMYVDTRTNSAYAVMTAMQKKKIKQEGKRHHISYNHLVFDETSFGLITFQGFQTAWKVKTIKEKLR